MVHTAKNFDYLIGEVKGISEKQFKTHLELYQSYVRKINEIEEKLRTVSPGASSYTFGEFSELHRRKAVAYNGAYLHQLYFENLGGRPTVPSGKLKQSIERDFGSFDKWLADMRAGLYSAHGWLLLCRSRFDGSLRNCVIEEHHRGLLVEHDVLLSLDGWEHAYMIDYGTNKESYIKVLESSINWNVVSSRFEALEGFMKAAA